MRPEKRKLSGNEGKASVTKKTSNVEAMLARLMSEIEDLKSERQEPSKATPKKSKTKLQKQLAEGTKTLFWETRTPVTIRQADADHGRFYKSVEGKRIRVFFVNKNFPQAPIVGAIEIQPGVWDARVWNHDGGMRVPYGHGSNIAGFWEE